MFLARYNTSLMIHSCNKNIVLVVSLILNTHVYTYYVSEILTSLQTGASKLTRIRTLNKKYRYQAIKQKEQSKLKRQDYHMK